MRRHDAASAEASCCRSETRHLACHTTTGPWKQVRSESWMRAPKVNWIYWRRAGNPRPQGTDCRKQGTKPTLCPSAGSRALARGTPWEEDASRAPARWRHFPRDARRSAFRDGVSVALGGGADLLNMQVTSLLPKPPVGEGGGRAMPFFCLKFFELSTIKTIFSPSDFRSSHIPPTHPADKHLLPSPLSRKTFLNCSETQLLEVRGVQGGEEIDWDR